MKSDPKQVSWTKLYDSWWVAHNDFDNKKKVGELFMALYSWYVWFGKRMLRCKSLKHAELIMAQVAFGGRQ